MRCVRVCVSVSVGAKKTGYFLGTISLVNEAWRKWTHLKPFPLPANQLLSTAVFAALNPLHSSFLLLSLLPPPPLLSLFAHLLTSPPSTHTALFVFLPAGTAATLDLGSIALAWTQLPRIIYLTQNTSLPTIHLCYHRRPGVPKRTMYLWRPSFGLCPGTQRDFRARGIALLQLLNVGCP